MNYHVLSGNMDVHFAIALWFILLTIFYAILNYGAWSYSVLKAVAERYPNEIRPIRYGSQMFLIE